MDPHQPIAELFNDWLGNRRNARRHPRLGDEPRFVRRGVGNRKCL
jgi:hypothetical protein